MAYTYATKAMTLDGKHYNKGDILPAHAGDALTLKRFGRTGNATIEDETVSSTDKLLSAQKGRTTKTKKKSINLSRHPIAPKASATGKRNK